MKITATCKCGARITVEDVVSFHTEITRNEDSVPCPNHGKILQCNCFPPYTSITHQDGSPCNCPA